MGSMASIDLFYADREAARFDDAEFDKDDIMVLLLKDECLCIGGHRTGLHAVLERKEQDIYEFCVALMRGEMPDTELLREKLNEQLELTSDSFATEIEA